MKNLVKPACILLFFLAFFVLFFVGAFIAGISGVGANQGLASGAIVLGYGFIAGLAGGLAAIFLAIYARHGIVVRINQLLILLFAAIITLIVFRYQKNRAQTPENTNREVTIPVKFINYVSPSAIISGQQAEEEPLGLGFFKPDFVKHPVLYFYGTPELGTPMQEHQPVDSLVFEKKGDGKYDIRYAPPWLFPAHLKMDYEIVLFKALTVGHDFVEIVVNNKNNQASYIDRSAGELLYWPDFFLHINSVKFVVGEEQKIRLKPTIYASEISSSYQFLQPIAIQDDWMLVGLLNADLKVVDKGWIFWRRGNKLLLSYSLLS